MSIMNDITLKWLLMSVWPEGGLLSFIIGYHISKTNCIGVSFVNDGPLKPESWL